MKMFAAYTHTIERDCLFAEKEYEIEFDYYGMQSSSLHDPGSEGEIEIISILYKGKDITQEIVANYPDEYRKIEEHCFSIAQSDNYGD
jgi:hypothetical protein